MVITYLKDQSSPEQDVLELEVQKVCENEVIVVRKPLSSKTMENP